MLAPYRFNSNAPTGATSDKPMLVSAAPGTAMPIEIDLTEVTGGTPGDVLVVNADGTLGDRTLTAGAGITITPAAGSITIASDNPTDNLIIGTTPITSGTASRILFEGAGNVVQEDAGLIYDATNDQLQLPTTGSGAGILIGGDTQLYRSAANTLRTPDALTVDGLTTAGAALTVTTGNLNMTAGDIILDDGQINVTDSTVDLIIRNNTADASDTKGIILQGGGAGSQSRGASVHVRGNEYTGDAGSLFLRAGAVATGAIYFYTDSTHRGNVANDGTWTIPGRVYVNTELIVATGLSSEGSNGYAHLSGSVVAGGCVLGKGSTSDVSLINAGGNQAAHVPTGTQNFTIIGALAKGSGTFDEPHPLDPTKRLRHPFIEGPRYDLNYRGRANIVGGVAVVDLNKDCTNGAPMTPGTFSALTRYADAWINKPGCEGTVNGDTLTITGPDGPVAWLVVAERKDNHIMFDESGFNDADGNPILEYTESSLKAKHAARIRLPGAAVIESLLAIPSTTIQ